MKKLAAFALGCSLLFGSVAPAVCAELTGIVTNLQNQPVSGIKIVVQNSANQLFGQGITGANGRYQITGITPTKYEYLLNPMMTGYKSGSAVSYLGPKGLVINWKVSRTGDALALAVDGGLSSSEVGSIIVLGAGAVAAGVIGGYGAAGGFSTHSNYPPSSSSM